MRQIEVSRCSKCNAMLPKDRNIESRLARHKDVCDSTEFIDETIDS